MRGRKRARKLRRIKAIFNTLIITTTLGIIFFLGVEEYKESKVKRQKLSYAKQYNVQYIDTTYKQEENQKQENREEPKKQAKYPKEEITKEYKGYKVSAKLEIPQIELETYILSTYSEKALNISATKFWGADANKIGNFCVAGHNVKNNKNMFHNLLNLKIGETLWVTDNEIGKIEYEIYDIYKVNPEDVKCLSQETGGRREITLITCTTDSKKRVIVKATEKE